MSKEMEMKPIITLSMCLLGHHGDEICRKLVSTPEVANKVDLIDVPNWFHAAGIGYIKTVEEALERGVDKNMLILFDKKEVNVLGYVQYCLVHFSTPDPDYIKQMLDMMRFLIGKGVTPPADLYESIMKSALSKTEPIYKGVIPDYMKFLLFLNPVAGGRRKSRKNRKNRKNRQTRRH